MNTKDDTYIAMKMEYFLKLWKKKYIFNWIDCFINGLKSLSV